MKEGISYRDFEVTSPKGNTLKIHVEHINSMANQNLCLIKYSVTSVNYEGKVSIVPYINGDVKHETSNFNEKCGTYSVRKQPTNMPIYGHKPNGKIHRSVVPDLSTLQKQ